jgi:hypothetical protein
MMRRKVLVILTILAVILVFVVIMVMQIFRSDNQVRQIKDEIEQRSGRQIKISSLSNMYYQAIRKGDDIEFVHQVIVNNTRVKTGNTTRKGVSYKFEEYAFDEDVATVYLYIEYGMEKKVSYIALQ